MYINLPLAAKTYPAATKVQESNPYYENGMTRVDIDGIRYYVRDGRYYRRNANGEYATDPLNRPSVAFCLLFACSMPGRS